MPLIDDIKRKVDLTISIKGSFNPTIFQPYWFEKMGLLEAHEINSLPEEAEIMVHKEVAILKSTFFNLRCTNDKFTIWCRPYEFSNLLIDIVTGIFTILNQTPVSEVQLMADIHHTLQGDDGFGKVVNYTINGFDSCEFENPKLKSLSLVDDVEESLNPQFIRIDDCANNKRHIQIYIGRDFHLKSLYSSVNFGEVIPEFLSTYATDTFEALISRIKDILDYGD